MAESRDELVHFLNQRLNAALIPDSCPTGLQVYGRTIVESVVTAVSASLELFQIAAEKKAAEAKQDEMDALNKEIREGNQAGAPPTPDKAAPPKGPLPRKMSSQDVDANKP